MKSLSRLKILTICLLFIFSYGHSQISSPVDSGKRVLSWNEAVNKWIAEFKDKPAPDFQFVATSGSDYKLSDLGDKLILLDFWGSWCGTCLDEFPKLKKAYVDYAGKVTFIGIDNDVKKNWTEDSLKAFSKKMDLTWTQVLDDRQPSICKQYGIKFYPTFMLVRSGRIIACHWLVDEI